MPSADAVDSGSKGLKSRMKGTATAGAMTSGAAATCVGEGVAGRNGALVALQAAVASAIPTRAAKTLRSTRRHRPVGGAAPVDTPDQSRPFQIQVVGVDVPDHEL